MQTMSAFWSNDITSQARTVSGKVELYNGSTLSNGFYPNTRLSSMKVERTPTNGSFWGYTISQKATVKLLNKENDINDIKGNNMKLYLGVGGDFANFAMFKITDCKKDEVKGTVELIGYDLISTAAEHTLNEIEITYPAEIMDYARAIAAFLGVELRVELGNSAYHQITFDGDATQPNYEGTETLREVLEDIAQATGTICYIDYLNRICFKHIENTPIYTVDKSQYFSLEVSEPIAITKVSATTELGDNLSTGTDAGHHHIIHDNGFYVDSVEAAASIEKLLADNSTTAIYPYKLKWRANPAIEIGDCFNITLKDGSTIPLIYLGETIQYTGGMSATSEWKSEEKKQVSSNPTTIGEAIKQTYAKVDKVNKQIDMVVSESSANAEAVAAIQLNLDGISASVSNMETITSEAIEGMSESISTLQTTVDATMSADAIEIAIKSELANGVEKIETATGYTFNEEGLTVSKSDSEMKTTITEDGMKVYKNDDEVLVANNIGVQAKNLEATTYLIIGKYSRFEDYINVDDKPRTGCFWIGD